MDRFIRWFFWLTCHFDSPDPPKAPKQIPLEQQVAAMAGAIPSAYTPYGQRVFSGDPNKPGDFHYTETLSPEQQTQLDYRNRIAEAMLGTAEGHAAQLPDQAFRFDPNNPVTNQYWEAQQALLDPYFAREGERLDQDLYNKGLPMGSEAYTESMDDFSRRKNEAYAQAAAASLDKGYQQAIGTRQQNYNELAALLGGQQLQPVNYSPGAGVDVSGALSREQAARNNAYNAQLAQYNAGVGSGNSFMGGLFGLGQAAIPVLF